MKALISAMVCAVLVACGGGGGGGTSTEAKTSSCNYATVSDTAPVQIAGDAGTQSITDTTKRLAIIITGSANTVRLGPCVYVESLSISGSANTVNTDASSRIEGVRFEINSGANTVWVPASTSAAVTDLGNSNSVKRY